MHQIFISHAEEDANLAFQLANSLEEAGYKVWYFERDTVPGVAYLAQVGAAIEEAQAVVLLISADWIESNQVNSEVVRAYESRKQFIPLLRGITHAEFQRRQPAWRQALGAAATLQFQSDKLGIVSSKILDGLRMMGVHPASAAGLQNEVPQAATLSSTSVPGRLGVSPPANPAAGGDTGQEAPNRETVDFIAAFSDMFVLILGSVLLVIVLTVLAGREGFSVLEGWPLAAVIVAFGVVTIFAIHAIYRGYRLRVNGVISQPRTKVVLRAAILAFLFFIPIVLGITIIYRENEHAWEPSQEKTSNAERQDSAGRVRESGAVLKQYSDESVSREDALRALKGYMVGIYYDRGSKRLSEVARDLQDRLARYGLERSQLQLNGRDKSFFEEVVPPRGFEIRYEPGQEDYAADALAGIIREVYSSQVFTRIAVAAGRTENYISLFLGDKATAIPNATNAITNNWGGTWQTICAGKSGSLGGTLSLYSTPGLGLQGTYTHRAAGILIRGWIAAAAESDGSKLIGTWRNESNEQGCFVFELSPDGRSFTGRYSMSEETPPKGSANWWNGQRVTPAGKP